MINVGIGRHNIEIARQNDRRVQAMKFGCVLQEPSHPGEFVVKFRTRLRIIVRGIKRCDEHVRDGRLHVPALPVRWISRERGARQDWTGAAENRDAIP